MPSFLASGLIEVVPGLMIWTLIAFGITFFVLRRFAFGPIQKTIDARRDRIRAAVDEADKAREEARELLEQHRQSRNLVRLRVDVDLSQDGAGVVVEGSHQVDSVMAAAFGAAQVRAIDGDHRSGGAGCRPCGQRFIQYIGVHALEQALDGRGGRSAPSGVKGQSRGAFGDTPQRRIT